MTNSEATNGAIIPARRSRSPRGATRHCGDQAIGSAQNGSTRINEVDGNRYVVVEGVVQVSTVMEQPASANEAEPTRSVASAPLEVNTNPAALRLAAGEKAQVSSGGMKISPSQNLEDVLSRRQRRLTFRDARLADVAAEFNRYYHSQISIERVAAHTMEMTGIFDTDHPQAIILFARKNETLLVEAEGENWVIRSRE
jgi:ferric-dicitrate binding protein FerR (iron transport regulator)